MRPLRAAARTMLAAVFVTEGLNALRNPEQLAERAKPVTDRLAPALSAVHPKLPTDAETLVRVNGATQVTAGLLLATGHATTPAALALAGSLVPTTLAGHRFWENGDRMQRTQFMKNLGLLGGLIFAALDRQGRPGLAWQAGHLTKHARNQAGHLAKHARDRARHLTDS